MQGESPLLFCAQSGDPLVQISRKLTDFSAEISARVQPSGKAVDTLLASNAELFKGRSRGDICSKVRNVI